LDHLLLLLVLVAPLWLSNHQPRSLCRPLPRNTSPKPQVSAGFFSLGVGLILNSTNFRLLESEKLIRKRLDRKPQTEPWRSE
jgi:hypothetical protein